MKTYRGEVSPLSPASSELRPVPALSPEVLDRLQSYPFPGSIRELENILERALIYCEGNTITVEDIGLLPAARQELSAGTPAIKTETGTLGDKSLEEVEKKAILEALSHCNGSRTRAAEILGVSRKTILNKMKAYGIKQA